MKVNGDHVDAQSANCETQENEEDANEVELHFEPIVSLPLIEVSTNEEDEVEMIKLRAKLYRYDSASKPAEWKERGTGEVKLLRHKIKNTVRVVMRRDKTYKICANHFVTPWMELKPNCGSDKAWVWSVLADYADEQLKPELLAIRFANAENATAWKEAFEKAKEIVGSECEIYAGKNNMEEKHVESDSEPSSVVSSSESTDNEDEAKRQTGEESKDENDEIETAEKKQIKDGENMDKVSKDLEQLQVKDAEQKK
ncbi:ran-specific GTPase-activating protein-like [Ceratina calcarata]|uniref:Ran-specific GTPase-activating protein-like n=1 Tax=Ceratina calcarata TaxID=156304 RepID=A0AAJ7S078_9HYME|nr:ran-specific GTPase-activating protein-like [Ceratina calcarata]XP_026668951.1 ran-specific GTPase-activating protein-like [Ceratina calcarata]